MTGGAESNKGRAEHVVEASGKSHDKPGNHQDAIKSDTLDFNPMDARSGLLPDSAGVRVTAWTVKGSHCPAKYFPKT